MLRIRLYRKKTHLDIIVTGSQFVISEELMKTWDRAEIIKESGGIKHGRKK